MAAEGSLARTMLRIRPNIHLSSGVICASRAPFPSAIAGPSSLRYSSFPIYTRRSLSSTSSRREIQRDNEITYRQVHTVNEDGSLGELRMLHHIMYDVDLKTHSVLLVSEDPPVVKIVSRIEEARAEKRRLVDQKTAKKMQLPEKEVQISWNSADGDLETKLNQAKVLLENGHRVMLVFAPRGGRKKQQSSERMEYMAGFMDKGLAEVATKWKEDAFRGRVVSSFWQPQQEVTAAVRTKVMDFLSTQQKGKDELKEARRLAAQQKVEAAARKREEERLEGEKVMQERQHALAEAEERERERQKIELERQRAEGLL